MSVFSWLKVPSRRTSAGNELGRASFVSKLRCAAAVLAASAGLTWVAPAAAVPGLVLVASAPTASNSVSPKTATVSCTTVGHKIFAVGAQITHAGVSSGEVYLDQNFPDNALTTSTARAVEHAVGFAGNWSLTAFALCGDATGLNLRRAKSTTAISVSDDKSITASCNLAGERVYGSGFALHDQAIGRIFPAQASLITAGTNGVTARAVTDTPPLATAWDLDVLAICGLQAPGYTVDPDPGVSNSTSPKSETNSCPLGTKVHGLGWSRNAVTAVQRDLVTEDIDINTSGGNFKVVENDATLSNWAVDNTLICAN